MKKLTLIFCMIGFLVLTLFLLQGCGEQAKEQATAPQDPQAENVSPDTASSEAAPANEYDGTIDVDDSYDEVEAGFYKYAFVAGTTRNIHFEKEVGISRKSLDETGETVTTVTLDQWTDLGIQWNVESALLEEESVEEVSWAIDFSEVATSFDRDPQDFESGDLVVIDSLVQAEGKWDGGDYAILEKLQGRAIGFYPDEVMANLLDDKEFKYNYKGKEYRLPFSKVSLEREKFYLSV